MGIVGTGLTERLVNMARFRHRLVHLYSNIDNQLVFSFIRDGLDDISEFGQIIANLQ